MEDVIRYLIIGIGIVYALYKIRMALFSENAGCGSCSHKEGCSTASMRSSSQCSDASMLNLSENEKKRIREIKLQYQE